MRIQLLALCGVLACGPDAAPPDYRQTEAHLQAQVAGYDSAWQARDAARVASMLAPEYAYFTSSGGVSSRAETLEFLRDPSYRLDDMARSEIRVTIAGPVARVSSRWRGRGEYQGRPVLDDQTCGQVWAWRGDRWQLFTEHCVNRAKQDS